VLHAAFFEGTRSLALAAALTVQAPGSNAAGYATPGADAATPTEPVRAEAVPAPGGETASAGGEAASPGAPAPVVSSGSMATDAAPGAEPGPTPMHLRPPPPRRDGRGLLIAAGVMGAINVGLAVARLGLSLGESTAEREQARLMLTAIVMPIDVAAGIGLAAAGGHFRGRGDGYRTAFDLSPKLRASAFTGSGTVLLVMGAVAWASAWTPWHGDPSLDARGGGSLLVESAGSLLLMGGTGLVAYGVSWKRHTERYGRSVPIALRPAFGRGFAGLTLGGRF
jgi:hypothetical protein